MFPLWRVVIPHYSLFTFRLRFPVLGSWVTKRDLENNAGYMGWVVVAGGEGQKGCGRQGQRKKTEGDISCIHKEGNGKTCGGDSYKKEKTGHSRVRLKKSISPWLCCHIHDAAGHTPHFHKTTKTHYPTGIKNQTAIKFEGKHNMSRTPGSKTAAKW